MSRVVDSFVVFVLCLDISFLAVVVVVPLRLLLYFGDLFVFGPLFLIRRKREMEMKRERENSLKQV